MGGNALNTPTKRISAAQYHALVPQLEQQLRSAFGVRAQAVPAYRQKEDFGDIDVVLEHPSAPNHQHQPLIDFAQQHWHSRAVHKNNAVLSLEYRSSPDDEEGVQVDLLLAAPQDFDPMLHYFSYNDLGNLVGRIAHKMGFVYGHTGLIYHWRDGNHLFRTLMVTQDTSQALRTLGYDPAPFLAGFDRLEDVFSYAASSPYFNPQLYVLEERNHAARTRDRKRVSYQKFLQYCQTASFPNPAYDFPTNKELWLPSFFAQYPTFEQQWKQAESDLAQLKAIKELFNGQVVAQWTGLSGKDLGAFMSNIRAEFSDTSSFARFCQEQGTRGLEDYVRSKWSSPAKHMPPS